MPTSSSDGTAKINDTMPATHFGYRYNPTGTANWPPYNYVLMDWASQLIPYLGKGGADSTFENAPTQQTRVFQCPSDVWVTIDVNPGYDMINNIVIAGDTTNNYVPISYGINADITLLCDSHGGQLGEPNGPWTVSVYGGPNAPNGTLKPLGCKMNRVYKSAETLLFADCGTRPQSGGYTSPLDRNDCLYYSTNYIVNYPTKSMIGGYMSYIAQISWLGNRIPLAKAPLNPSKVDRHMGGYMNIAFCDGHVESLGFGDLNRVRISPYRY